MKGLQDDIGRMQMENKCHQDEIKFVSNLFKSIVNSREYI